MIDDIMELRTAPKNNRFCRQVVVVPECEIGGITTARLVGCILRQSLDGRAEASNYALSKKLYLDISKFLFRLFR
jgi:hypothetical protein